MGRLQQSRWLWPLNLTERPLPLEGSLPLLSYSPLRTCNDFPRDSFLPWNCRFSKDLAPPPHFLNLLIRLKSLWATGRRGSWGREPSRRKYDHGDNIPAKIRVFMIRITRNLINVYSCGQMSIDLGGNNRLGWISWYGTLNTDSRLGVLST